MEKNSLQSNSLRSSPQAFSLVSCLCGDDYDEVDREDSQVARLISNITISPILLQRFAPVTRYFTSHILTSGPSHQQSVVETQIQDVTPLQMRKLYRRGLAQQPMNVPARYTYVPLKEDEIRVITFDDSSLAEVVIRLEVRKRNNPRSYEAVSYAWGDEDNPRLVNLKVRVPGGIVDLEVRENVVQMLQHLRGRRLPLWIDAICINQGGFRNMHNSDDTIVPEEKSAQVQHMGDVYRGAVRTLVWLGPTATTLLHRFKNTWPNKSSIKTIKDCVEPLLITLYFTRRWIIQELFLSREVLLLDGRDGMDFKLLVEASDFLLQNMHHHDREENRRLLNAMQLVSILQELRTREEDVHTKGVQDFMRLLVTAHISNCGNARDRIYALSALGGPDRATDYNVKPDNLFSNFAKEECLKSLETLYCSGAFPAAAGAKLASWVPDWRSARVWIPISLLHKLDVGEANFASTMRQHDLYPRFSPVVQGGNVLVVRGVQISRLKSIQCVSTIGGLFDFFRSYSDCDQLPQDHAIDRLIQTLTLDSIRSGKIAHEWLQVYRNSNGAICPLQQHGSVCDHVDSKSRHECNVLRRIEDVMTGRCAFVTQDGHWAVGPRGAQQGDVMVRLDGCRFPFVMRRQGRDWILIGDCYFAPRIEGQPESYAQLKKFNIV